MLTNLDINYSHFAHQNCQNHQNCNHLNHHIQKTSGDISHLYIANEYLENLDMGYLDQDLDLDWDLDLDLDQDWNQGWDLECTH